MNKTVLILSLIFLFPCSMALALHESGGGFSGGGSGGDRGNSGAGGGGYNGTDTTRSTAVDNKTDARESTGTTRVRSAGNKTLGNRTLGNSWRIGNSWNRSRLNGTSRFRANNTPHHFNHSNGTAGYNGSSFSRRVNTNHFASSGSAAKGKTLPMSLQHSSMGLPTKGPGGKPFSASLVSPKLMSSSAMKVRMSSIAQSKGLIGKIGAFNKAETLRNHYYWHTWGGYPYAHYWDGWGGNWYGWCWGNSFFWTQFYGDNWWWYDPYGARWCYWWNNGWCWNDPETTVVYVYQNGNYSPANGSENDNYQANQSQQEESSNSVGEQQADGAVAFHSPDGSLMVKVLTGGDAFLYNQENPGSKPVFLDSHVSDVKFSNQGRGTTRVLLIMDDGSFETYGSDGIPEGQAKS